MRVLQGNGKKMIIVAILSAVALCSVFVFSKIATNPATYQTTIQSIDSKKAAVTEVTAAAAAASAVLAVVPGDVTTPIANQIMQVTSCLLAVVCVLVLEKSLLTVMGYIAFRILIPIACVLFGINIFLKKDILKAIAIKLIVFAMVAVTIIPFSLKIGDMICEVNTTTIETVTNAAEETESEAEELSWKDKVLNSITNGVSEAKEYGKQKLNQLIDVIAVFIVAYCAIPLLTVIMVIWLVKLLFGRKASPSKTVKETVQSKQKV